MRTIVVGTAGHIDHGKSSLVRALTGTDPDRLKEEKARGITIELGFAHTEVAEGVTVSFIDVPGHERFVRAMLAGASGIDAVLLAVAADDGVMPQTREHFDICRLLGVTRGAVVLTKADAADPEMIDLVAADVRGLVAGSFLERAPVLAVSAATGDGLDALRTVLAGLAADLPQRDAAGPARLPVDRAFTLRGFGTVATGTLASGTVGVEDDLELLPAGRVAKARGLHVHGRPRSTAVAGERLAVNLPAFGVADVPRGSVLASPGAFAATRRADAEFTLLPEAPPLRHGARVRVHQGTAEILARVSVAGASGAVAPGHSAFVRLRFETPAVLARRDRFVVRTYSPLVTIGGGVVLDPDPPRAGLRAPAAAARVEALRLRRDPDADARIAIARMVADGARPGGTPLTRLAQRLGLGAARLDAAVAALEEEGAVVTATGWVADRPPLAASCTAMLSGIAAFHRERPLAEGMPIEEARTRWFDTTPAAIFERVLAELVAAGRVVARGTLALPGHRVTLSAEEADVLERLEAQFRAAGLQPPDPATLGAGAAGERVLQYLLKQKRLVRVDTLVFHHEALDRLKADIAGRKTGAGRATVNVQAFKDAYGVTRKYAIPLLEYLDRERVTRREGDVRVVL